MFIGFVRIENGAVVTHRDSYRIEDISVVSVRKPHLPGALLLSTFALGFAVVFGDLLYPQEILFLISGCVIILLAGTQIGQLSLLSRDLRGSELSSAIWGHHKNLQAIRTQIMGAVRSSKHGVEHG